MQKSQSKNLGGWNPSWIPPSYPQPHPTLLLISWSHYTQRYYYLLTFIYTKDKYHLSYYYFWRLTARVYCFCFITNLPPHCNQTPWELCQNVPWINMMKFTMALTIYFTKNNDESWLYLSIYVDYYMIISQHHSILLCTMTLERTTIMLSKTLPYNIPNLDAIWSYNRRVCCWRDC